MSRTWLRQLLGGKNHSQPVRRQPRPARPAVEHLETRELLTLFIPPPNNPPSPTNPTNPTTPVVKVTLPPLSVSQSDVNLPYVGTLTDPYGTLVSAKYLPPGLTASHSGSTLTLSGTPTQAGAYLVTLDTLVITPYSRVIYEGTCGLVISPTLSLGSLNAGPWVVGQAGSGSIPITGGTPAFSNLAVTGLPPGLTAALSGNAITLSGTPSVAGTIGKVTVSLQDADGETVRQTYSVTVYLGVSPGALPAGDVGLAYRATFGATGGSGHYYFTNSGALPPGLSLSGAGVLSGTPTAPGSYSFFIDAFDDANANVTGSQVYTLTVNPPLGLGSLSATQWTAGQPGYSGNIPVSGGSGAYSHLTVTGLPAGVGAALSGSTITLSGTPATAGRYTFTVSLQDGLGATVSGTFTLAISLGISPGTLPAATAGQLYSATISAQGGSGHYSYSLASGALPPGLSLSAVGVLSGTTTVAGTYGFTVQATDTAIAGATGSASYQLTVSPAAVARVWFSTQPPTSLVAGSAFHVAVQVADQNGNPVPGTTITIADGTGSVTVTADARGQATFGNGNDEHFLTYIVAGTYRLTATVSGVAPATSNAFTVLPAAAASVVVTPSTLTPTAGVPFTVTVTATDAYGNGCNGPATLTSSDSLSQPLQVSGGTARATVTLTTAHAVTLTATMGGVSGSRTVVVAPAPATVARFVVSAPATGFTNDHITVTVTAEDSAGHTVNYSGPVALTSSNGQVVAATTVMLANGTGQVTLTLAHSGTAALSVAGSIPSNSATITVNPSLYQFDYELVAYDESGGQIATEDYSIQARNAPAALAIADAVGNAWAEQLSNGVPGSVYVLENLLDPPTPLN
jgi:hypothetical protein